MQTELLINPALKEKFKAVLRYLEENPKQNINVKLISEIESQFTIEYEKPRDLFNLGRAFEPYKMAIPGSFKVNFDNSYLSRI